MEVEGVDVGDGGVGLDFVADGAADGGDGVDAVAVLDGEAVAHEAAHGEAHEEDVGLIDVVGADEIVEDGHDEAGIVNAIIDDDVV